MRNIKHSLSFQLGIGLIELLVSMFIGLFIMAGVLQMFSTSSANTVALAGMSRIQENVRYVFSRLEEDIGQSGSLGCINAARNGRSNSNPMDLDGYFVNNLLGEQSAYGERYDFTTLVSGVVADSLTLPEGRIVTGTDTFRLRYVDTRSRIDLLSPTSNSSTSISVDASDADFDRLSVGDIAYLGDCSKAAVFVITGVSESSGVGTVSFTTGTADADTRAQYNRHSRIQSSSRPFLPNNTNVSAQTFAHLYGGETGAYQYFIGNSAGQTCGDSAIQNCALFRGDNANPQGLEVAQGVHDMSVRYGWTDNSGNYHMASVDGLPDSLPFPGEPDWSLVDRLEVTLSFNSIDQAITSGNQLDQAQSGLLQKTVTRTFNLANQL